MSKASRFPILSERPLLEEGALSVVERHFRHSPGFAQSLVGDLLPDVPAARSAVGLLQPSEDDGVRSVQALVVHPGGSTGILFGLRDSDREEEPSSDPLRLRGLMRQGRGEFDNFICVLLTSTTGLLALNSARDLGWDDVLGFQELALHVLNGHHPGAAHDAGFLVDLALKRRSEIAPPDTAIQRFWEGYGHHVGMRHDGLEVSLSARTLARQGGVWPDFFASDFAEYPSRCRFRILHVPEEGEVRLLSSAAPPIGELVAPPQLAQRPAGPDRTSFVIQVPPMDTARPFLKQAPAADQSIAAAKLLRNFFAANRDRIVMAAMSRPAGASGKASGSAIS